MKWPETLTVIRHGQSAYNAIKAAKADDPVYEEFMDAYKNRRKDPELAVALAKTIQARGDYVLGVGDHDTPLTDLGREQAITTGTRLKEKIEVPDIVLVSPYLRTKHTLQGLQEGWPELGEVKTVEEERIREQEHGLKLIYKDWRIFHVLNPEQESLYEREGRYWYRHPQGENVPDVRERTRSLLGTITRDYCKQNVLMVTHHLTKLSLRANLERLGAEEFQELDRTNPPINCGVTIYRGNPNAGSDGHLELDIYNQQLYES